MKMIGPWFVPELEALKIPNLSYRVAPLPVPDGADPRAATTFADLKSIVVFAGPNARAAARFAAYLTSAEADRMLVEEASQLPYRRGLLSDRRFQGALGRWPTLDVFAGEVERTRDVDLHPDVVEIFDILSEAYEASAIYDRVPSAQGVREAATEARKLLRHAR
jgi:multiple sugar transport system substrate-binding protein